jgi:dTDP-3-amino-3,4,6-trideoxy-alpha-D-glucopyranose N,N-dimethyltransferase
VYEHSAAAYDLLNAARGKDYPREAAQVAELVRGRHPGARSLLDVGCGTGLHLVAFRRLGFSVAGVELSGPMAEVARHRLPGAEVAVADMRTFRLGRAFDAVVCLFSAIGYMPDTGALGTAVATMAGHLVPGGVLVVEPWLAPVAWHVGMVSTDSAEADGLTVTRVSRSALWDDRSTIDMHYVIATPERSWSFVEHHRLRLFSTDDYLEAFDRAGLRVEHEAAGLTGRGLVIGTRPPVATRNG